MNTAQRVQQHRKRLKEQGFRPYQLWVFDVRNKAFQEQCKQQARVIKNLSGDDTLEAFNKIADTDGWV